MRGEKQRRARTREVYFILMDAGSHRRFWSRGMMEIDFVSKRVMMAICRNFQCVLKLSIILTRNLNGDVHHPFF